MYEEILVADPRSYKGPNIDQMDFLDVCHDLKHLIKIS